MGRAWGQDWHQRLAAEPGLSGQISPHRRPQFPHLHRGDPGRLDCELAPQARLPRFFNPRWPLWSPGRHIQTSHLTGGNTGLAAEPPSRQLGSSGPWTGPAGPWLGGRSLAPLSYRLCGRQVGMSGTQQGLGGPRSGWTAAGRCSITPRSATGVRVGLQGCTWTRAQHGGPWGPAQKAEMTLALSKPRPSLSPPRPLHQGCSAQGFRRAS